ncbi:MAG TPA: tetratricopeptide repeat protein [Nocardioidaceae bacterium]|nr:tetratricopeptide repeat protein [Nocardioidaceae bacterium]
MADQHKPRGDQRGQQRPGRRPPKGEQRRGQTRRPERDGQAAARQPSRTAEQARYDGPPLDDSIKSSDLSREVRQQLRGLPEKLAARVARHLVAAAQLIDEDPRTAYEHTLAARGRAARIAVVREACGEAAYAAGEYSDALSELRAARRMNGQSDYLPVMADCERALGRPERAVALAQDPAVANLDEAGRAEMTIVAAGARRDLGQLDAALGTLEAAPLRSRSRAEWVARLRYAYADTLLAAGRREDALEWFHRAAGVDGAAVTDAVERIGELEGPVGD